MAEALRLICPSAELVDGAQGVRFEVPTAEGRLPAFAVRHRGRVYAYLNRCAHIGVELDWIAGRFFDVSGIYLICATHGALYAPETGECVAGPCAGGRLAALPVLEQEGGVYLKTGHRDG
jgi:nitrite reductase/ring-hydroxylating ferredoxin subunit